MTAYTRISFHRKDLFEVCKLGFMAQRVGTLWCEGLIPTDRVKNLQIAYRTL